MPAIMLRSKKNSLLEGACDPQGGDRQCFISYIADAVHLKSGREVASAMLVSSIKSYLLGNSKCSVRFCAAPNCYRETVLVGGCWCQQLCKLQRRAYRGHAVPALQTR